MGLSVLEPATAARIETHRDDAEVLPWRPRAVRPAIDLDAAFSLIELVWKTAQHQCFPCSTSSDRNLADGRTVHPESFTAMVIADLLLGQRKYSMLVRSVLSMLERELGKDDVFYFFKDHERLPADADCTALGLSVLLRGGVPVHKQAHRALDRILLNRSEDGVIETYFDPTGERSGIIDPVVCVNTLFLGYTLGRGSEMQATLQYVADVLEDEAYLEGSRYYHSPDTFLYFLGRLVHHFPETHELLLEPLREAVARRQGATTHTLDIAQRVIVSRWLEIEDGGEGAILADLQEPDGCWPTDSLFRYGRRKVYFGSRVMTAAFAIVGLRRS